MNPALASSEVDRTPAETSDGRVRVAIAGIRGVPANFGGSETAAEEIGRRLAANGDTVVVYCRRHISTTPARVFRGMHRVLLPSIKTLQLDTITHSILAALHLRRTRCADIVHFHGVGNALVLPLLRGSRIKTVITIDGLDWNRPKWGRFASWMLRLSATLAVRWADHLIIDNHPARRYFTEHYGARSSYVPYGADLSLPESTACLAEQKLNPGGYVLFVGALVPDKGPDMLIEAYRRVATDRPLVIVGDSPFLPEYRAKLHRLADGDERIRFLGYLYGEEYRQLLANCAAYIHPLRADGTSPALLQAMAYGCCIVINTLPEALSAAGDAAVPFMHNDVDDLARHIQRVLDQPDLAADYGQRARAKAETEYNWNAVTDAHRAIYASLAK
jgi:glycosyltransferase involved in cell wall biosynthesis